MNSVYAELTCIGLTVAGFLALVIAGIRKQGEAAGKRERPEPEFEPEDLRDQVILMLLDEGMDPMEATQLVEEITSDFPEYGLEEILEEVRRR